VTPALPVRRRLPGPHRPLPLRGPLLRPNIGRRNSPDPSGQEQSPYLYAGGAPVNKIDPNGTLPFSKIGDALGKVTDYTGKARDAFDLYGASKDLVTGDVVGAARGFASFTAGFAVGAACTAATGPGTGFLSTAGCAAAGPTPAHWSRNGCHRTG
jgi:hypothetical protein